MLSSFGDNRPVPDGFDGSPDYLDAVLGQWDEWFSPHDGLRMAEGLLRLLESTQDEGDGGTRVDNRSAVIAELTELAACLREAVNCGSKFRLVLG
jgi:hypothetical protein